MTFCGHLSGSVSDKALEICSTYEAARINLAYLLQVEGRFMAAWNTLSGRGEGEGGGDPTQGRKGQKLGGKKSLAQENLRKQPRELLCNCICTCWLRNISI